MSVVGRGWVVVSLSLGVFLGSAALSGCLADEGESNPDLVEQEDVEDVDLALEEGEVLDVPAQGRKSDAASQKFTDAVDGESTDGPPGQEEQEPNPHPWFAPAEPVIDESEPAPAHI